MQTRLMGKLLAAMAVACLAIAIGDRSLYASMDEMSPSTQPGLEVYLAYVDPGMAGFLVVTVLGFLASVGYVARAMLRSCKKRLVDVLFRRKSDEDDPDETNS